MFTHSCITIFLRFGILYLHMIVEKEMKSKLTPKQKIAMERCKMLIKVQNKNNARSEIG